MANIFDWQEAIQNRSAYVEARLAGGTPVLMISIPEGILGMTYRRQAPKLFEIYDRLMMGALGQQSDMEQMRIAALDYAHQEGFQRSEQDVTIKRVVNALSMPLKRAFSDFNSSPFVLQCLFAEVGATPADDTYYLLDFDGDYTLFRNRAYITGGLDADQSQAIYEGLKGIENNSLSLTDAKQELSKIWEKALKPTASSSLKPEFALLKRNSDQPNRFQTFNDES